MTATDALVVLGLFAACLGFLAAVLGIIAFVSRAIQGAYDAAGRHIEQCMTQALQMPLYPGLEDEHRALIADRNITGYE